MPRRLTAADRALLKSVADARNFPVNTCPASRHTEMIGEALIRGERHGLLEDEPEHCGGSILSTVASLYAAWTEIARLKAMLPKETAEYATSTADGSVVPVDP